MTSYSKTCLLKDAQIPNLQWLEEALVSTGSLEIPNYGSQRNPCTTKENKYSEEEKLEKWPWNANIVLKRRLHHSNRIVEIASPKIINTRYICYNI